MRQPNQSVELALVLKQCHLDATSVNLGRGGGVEGGGRIPPTSHISARPPNSSDAPLMDLVLIGPGSVVGVCLGCPQREAWEVARIYYSQFYL